MRLKSESAILPGSPGAGVQGWVFWACLVLRCTMQTKQKKAKASAPPPLAYRFLVMNQHQIAGVETCTVFQALKNAYRVQISCLFSFSFSLSLLQLWTMLHLCAQLLSSYCFWLWILYKSIHVPCGGPLWTWVNLPTFLPLPIPPSHLLTFSRNILLSPC